MNAAHFHLMLNHVPVIGAVGLALLLAIAWARRDTSLAKLSLVLAAAVAAVSIIVYLTGEPAEELVENINGISEPALEAHEDAALAATVAFGVFGAGALALLAVFRRRTLPRWVAAAAFVAVAAIAGLMAWTANLGGQIRHTEIAGGSVTAAADRGDSDDREHSGGRDHDDR